MRTDDLCYRSIAEIGRLYRSRELSPVEVVEGTLARIERVEPSVNAYVTVCERSVRAEAKAAERRLLEGGVLPPLHGIPVSVKDNIATAGVRTTAGSRILAEDVPEHDAACVTALRRAGALLVGKTQLFEFAFGEAHEDHGHVHNPWALDRSTAGSSTGSVAAVAAGLCHGSVGTDAGGSIRVPAALTGVTGLKPTFDRLPRAGIVPTTWSLGHVGPIGRTVEDTALLFEALLGEPATSDLDAGVGEVTVGVTEPQASELIDPQVRAAVGDVTAVLEREGATLRLVALPDLLLARSVLWAIASAEATDYHTDWLASRPQDYHPVVRARLQRGAALPATAYVRAQRVRRRLVEQVEQQLAGVDALVLPVSPTTAYPLGARTVDVDGRSEDVGQAVTRYTPLASITGRPALSVPCGFSSDGLPIGVQIVGHPHEDETVLRVGQAYERATEWHQRHPALTETTAGQAPMKEGRSWRRA